MFMTDLTVRYCIATNVSADMSQGATIAFGTKLTVSSEKCLVPHLANLIHKLVARAVGDCLWDKPVPAAR